MSKGLILKSIKILIYFIIAFNFIYLIRFSIFGIPTTLLEILIYSAFFLLGILLIKNKNNFIHKLKTFITKNKTLFLSLFTLWIGIIISLFFSLDVKTSLGIFKAFFFDAILVLLIILLIFHKKNAHLLFSAIKVYGMLIFVISLYYIFNQKFTFDDRLQIFFNSPNFLAMAVAPPIFITFFDFLQKKQKIFNLLLFFGLLFVLMQTKSIGGIIGVFAALFYLTLKFNKKYLAFVFLLFLVFVLLNLNKIEMLLFEQRSSLETRIQIWKSSLLILKDNWIFGIAPGLFQEYYLNYQKYFPPYFEWAVPYPHNIFLAFFIQTGVLGFLGFLGILFYVFISKNENAKIILIKSYFIYFLIHGLIDTPFWKNDLALIFFVFLGVLTIIKTHQK